MSIPQRQPQPEPPPPPPAHEADIAHYGSRAGGQPPDLSRLYDIRPFDERDHADCRELYKAGLLGGKLAPNDTGVDIDDIRSAYLLDPLNSFWVAVISQEAPPELAGWLSPEDRPGCVVGMVGVQHHDEGVGEIRRLRVHPRHRRRGIGARMLETAIRFCRESGCLKVQLDSFVAQEPAIRLFERYHFRHGRTRQIGGKDLLYFYLDLYAQRPG